MKNACPRIRCPYCGTQSTDAATRERVPGGDSSFVCRNCGKAVEPPLAGNGIPAPPLQTRRRQRPLVRRAAGRFGQSLVGPAPFGRRQFFERVGQPDFHPAARRSGRSGRSCAAPVAAGVGLDRAGALPGGADRRDRLGALDSALARRAKGRSPAGHGRILAAAIGQAAATRPGERPPQAIVALGPKAVCRALEHISKDPGDGQHFQFVPGAVRALAGVGAEAVPGLCEGLHSPEPKVRAVAIEVLQQMGAAGRERARQSACHPRRSETARSAMPRSTRLGYLGADGGPAAKRLAEFVASPDRHARRHAIKALGRIGPAARDAAMAVLEKTADSDPDLDDPLVRVAGLETGRCRAAGPRGPPRSQRRT